MMDIAENNFKVTEFWKAVVQQNPDKIRKYFKETATIRWYNTNEEFTLDEFIRANCEYPGEWEGEVERIEEIEDPLMQKIRYLDKLIDELAKGKAMGKILRT